MLDLYPGVHAADAMSEGYSVHIRFRCNSIPSLKAISHCSRDANAGPITVVDEEFRSRYSTEGDDLWFFIEIEEDWNAPHPPRTSEIFGIFMARDLKFNGALSANDSDALQEAWNALPQ